MWRQQTPAQQSQTRTDRQTHRLQTPTGRQEKHGRMPKVGTTILVQSNRLLHHLSDSLPTDTIAATPPAYQRGQEVIEGKAHC